MAFHPYPQIIPDFFNRRGFGPPVGVTPPSTCPWIDHSVSGLMHATRRPIQTRFRCAYTYRLKLAAYTNSLTHYTKGTPSRFKTAPTACRHSVSGTLSLPLSGCFSPFPHGTCSLSVTEEYLGLEDGPPMFRQDFTCPALLEAVMRFTLTGLSPAMARLSRRFRLCTRQHWPGPRSLATTNGVSVDVLSSGYLDVSVRPVRLLNL